MRNFTHFWREQTGLWRACAAYASGNAVFSIFLLLQPQYYSLPFFLAHSGLTIYCMWDLPVFSLPRFSPSDVLTRLIPARAVWAPFCVRVPAPYCPAVDLAALPRWHCARSYTLPRTHTALPPAARTTTATFARAPGALRYAFTLRNVARRAAHLPRTTHLHTGSVRSCCAANDAFAQRQLKRAHYGRVRFALFLLPRWALPFGGRTTRLRCRATLHPHALRLPAPAALARYL